MLTNYFLNVEECLNAGLPKDLVNFIGDDSCVEIEERLDFEDEGDLVDIIFEFDGGVIEFWGVPKQCVVEIQ